MQIGQNQAAGRAFLRSSSPAKLRRDPDRADLDLQQQIGQAARPGEAEQARQQRARQQRARQQLRAIQRRQRASNQRRRPELRTAPAIQRRGTAAVTPARQQATCARLCATRLPTAPGDVPAPRDPAASDALTSRRDLRSDLRDDSAQPGSRQQPLGPAKCDPEGVIQRSGTCAPAIQPWLLLQVRSSARRRVQVEKKGAIVEQAAVQSTKATSCNCDPVKHGCPIQQAPRKHSSAIKGLIPPPRKHTSLGSKEHSKREEILLQKHTSIGHKNTK